MTGKLATALALVLLASPIAAKEDAQQSADPVADASVVEGPVQFNQGEKFVPLRVGQELREGDRVMALSKGSATIRFKDGCDLYVKEETMIEVPDRSTCAGAIVAASSTAPASSGAIGAAAGAGGVDLAGAAIVVGVGVVVGCITIWCGDDENENETASP